MCILVKRLEEKIISGGLVDRAEAGLLAEADLDSLCQAANRIRQQFCGNTFELCAIINAKSGSCTEDCCYCAQSGANEAKTAEYPLCSAEQIHQQLQAAQTAGIARVGIVTAGRRISAAEVRILCEELQSCSMKGSFAVCASLGLLGEADFKRLREAGISRIHNNLETSPRFFPFLCTTHSFTDKVEAIKAARRAGMEICSGGIMGIGESMSDRIELAFSLRELGVSSIPLNMLNPIDGTPLSDRAVLTIEQMRRIVALFRFILPKANIRMAGGRGLLPDKGLACFCSGANAAITGDMLTTSGVVAAEDKELVKMAGYDPVLVGCHQAAAGGCRDNV